MKRLIPSLAIVLFCASAVWAAAPAAITSLHDIRALSHAEAAKELRVAFEATVTYRRAIETSLFVQDGNEGIYVWTDSNIEMAPGDRVMVRGISRDSFRPVVIADSVTLIHHGVVPQAVPANFDEMTRAQRDCLRVAVRAVVKSANVGLKAYENDAHLVLLADGGFIDAFVNSSDATFLNGLLDAEVEVAGVAQMKFDGKMQQTGVVLNVSSPADVKILKRAKASPWTLPVTQMDEILTFYHATNVNRRVRVRGTVTYFEPGSALVLQSGAKSLWIMTEFERPLRIGSLADVTGFPDLHDNFLTLTNGEIQESNAYAPITPKPVTQRELTSSKHIFDLISIEAQVVMEVRESSQDQYVLISDGKVFSAIYRHPDGAGLTLQPLKHVLPGSKVSVAGICIPEGSNPFGNEVPFKILMRSPDDIAVVTGPSWLNIGNLMSVVGALLLAVIVSFLWGAALDRKVRRQAVALSARIAAEAALERRTTQIEQQRSQILEDINGTRPLTEILDKVFEAVSFRLNYAPCWCELAGGPRFGKPLPEADSRRIIHEDIPARSGPPLGTLFVALDLDAQPCAEEAKALTMGTRLASVAIETRRLYSDLVHRSEFDLLTDIENRFSLDKHLDALIETASQAASIFGLIYIDLDEFKQVNDEYGHQVGDLYLQEVAERMKRQLRPGDMLARLGGDEFAVLVPIIRCRADVEEIALRLERCFENPFALEGYVLSGSASVGIALYPADGITKDSLLDAADAAMYVAKNTKRQMPAKKTDPEFTI